jgi:hypothetical protein
VGDETQTEKGSTATEYEESARVRDDDCEVRVGILDPSSLDLSDEEREVLDRVAKRLAEQVLVEEKERHRQLNEAEFKLIEACLRNNVEVGAEQISLMIKSKSTANVAIINLTNIACVLISRLYPDAQSLDELADAFVRQVTEAREARARAAAEEQVVDLREEETVAQ